MNMSKFTGRFLLAVLSVIGLMESSAWACTAMKEQQGRTHFAFPATLSIPRDLEVGGVIYDTGGWVGSGEGEVDCRGLFQHYMGTGFLSGTSEVKVPGKTDVYSTSLPGVGVRVSWASSLNLPPSMAGGQMMRNPRSRTAIAREIYTPAQRWWIQLIKTGPITAGTLNVERARIYYENVLTNELIFTATTLTPSYRGCRLLNDNIPVPLPRAYLHNFSGVGSTAQPYEFDIGLDCDPDIKVSYMISGLIEAESVLKNSAGNNFAAGVGVQLLKRHGASGPLRINSRQEFQTVGAAGGERHVPLTARYYQTAEKMTRGEVLILAFLTLYYE